MDGSFSTDFSFDFEVYTPSLVIPVSQDVNVFVGSAEILQFTTATPASSPQFITFLRTVPEPTVLNINISGVSVSGNTILVQLSEADTLVAQSAEYEIWDGSNRLFNGHFIVSPVKQDASTLTAILEGPGVFLNDITVEEGTSPLLVFQVVDANGANYDVQWFDIEFAIFKDTVPYNSSLPTFTLGSGGIITAGSDNSIIEIQLSSIDTASSGLFRYVLWFGDTVVGTGRFIVIQSGRFNGTVPSGFVITELGDLLALE